MILTNEIGDIIRPDVFFYPVCKKYYCFQDLCKEIAHGNLPLQVDRIIIWFGNSQIYRLTHAQVREEVKKLLTTIWAKKPQAFIMFSTLIPTPDQAQVTAAAILKFNEALCQEIQGWKDSHWNVDVVPSHLLFVTEVGYLDECTGNFVETITFNQGAQADFVKSRLTISGWFKLRKCWLQELQQVQNNYERDLQVPYCMWKSPTPVIDLNSSRE